MAKFQDLLTGLVWEFEGYDAEQIKTHPNYKAVPDDFVGVPFKKKSSTIETHTPKSANQFLRNEVMKVDRSGGASPF